MISAPGSSTLQASVPTFRISNIREIQSLINLVQQDNRVRYATHDVTWRSAAFPNLNEFRFKHFECSKVCWH